MKVFISSVTYLLRDERNALSEFLRVVDHEPLRFEDFEALDRSGREACLTGVEAADVYVLLLGPRYGEASADSALSPTDEEFTRARACGIPVLVFTKATDEPDEPAQAAFKDRVGHFVSGRFWKTFADPLSLNLAVGEALKALPAPGGPLRLRRLPEPVAPPWLGEAMEVPPQVTAPRLEVHLVPTGTTSVIGANGLAAVAEMLARDARSSGFVSNTEPLDVGSDNGRAWAIRPPERSGGWQERTTEQYRGVVADAAGVCGAFVSLDIDFLGALVDRSALQRDIARLVSLAAPHAAATPEAVVAVGLSGAEGVWEGDEKQVGTRTSGPMHTGSRLAIRAGTDLAVERLAVTTSLGEVAGELAARVINELRSMRAR